MIKRKNMFLWAGLLALSLLAACNSSVAPILSLNQQVETGSEITISETGETNADMGAASVADAAEANSQNHDDAVDYTWDSAAVIPIVLNGDSITADGEGVTVDGSTVTITSAGTYSLSGALVDGQIIVDTEDEDIVQLILNGVNIGSSTSAPINIVSAEETMIILADGTDNYITDNDSYVFADPDEDEPNAANLTETWRPYIDTGENSDYAMGWEVGRQAEAGVIWHEGAYDSFTSILVFIPAAQSGLVVLTNLDDPDDFLEVMREAFTQLITSG